MIRKAGRLSIIVVIFSKFNPRTTVGRLSAPSFFVDSEKNKQILHNYSWNPLTHCLKFLTSWPQRLRLQVTLSDLTSSCVFQTLRACQKHIKDPNSLKLAVCNTDIGIYDLYISDFLYRWPQVISISWHSHFKSMVKNEVPLIYIRSVQLTQNHNQMGYAQRCGAVTFLVGSGSGSGSGEAIRLRLRLRLRVKLFCGSGSGSGSGQNVPAPAAPAPAPAPMIKSSYFQKCQMSKYDFLLTWPWVWMLLWMSVFEICHSLSSKATGWPHFHGHLKPSVRRSVVCSRSCLVSMGTLKPPYSRSVVWSRLRCPSKHP